MTNLSNPFQPAIDALEQELSDLERQGNALLTSINVLRARAGLPPRPGGGFDGATSSVNSAPRAGSLTIHSDTFTGKKLGSAVRQYLQMRKDGGGDAPATARDIFDALKAGGFTSGAKDDATAMVVLRTMLRKNTITFHRLDNGRYGLNLSAAASRATRPNAISSARCNAASAECDVKKD